MSPTIERIVGAKSIKLQSYTADSLVNKNVDPDRANHFNKFTISYDHQKEIAQYIIDKGGNFMSSLWDLNSIEALDPFIKIHKIGSGDLTNFPLIEEFCKTNKPLIISTAMSDIKMVTETVNFIQSNFPTYQNKNHLV